MNVVNMIRWYTYIQWKHAVLMMITILSSLLQDFSPPNRRDRIQLLNFEEPPVWKTCHDAMMPERCFASILAKIVCSAWQGGVRQVIPGASVLVLKHQELDLLEKLSSNILGYLTRRGWWNHSQITYKSKHKINCQMWRQSDRNGWNAPVKKKQLGEGLGCLARDSFLRPISWHQISQRIIGIAWMSDSSVVAKFFYDAIDTYFPSPTMAHSQRLVECCDGLM